MKPEYELPEGATLADLEVLWKGKLSDMSKEDFELFFGPVTPYECDSAVCCNMDDLPQDIKDRLHARKVQLEEYVAKIDAMVEQAEQNSIDVTDMDWNEFLAALGHTNPPEDEPELDYEKIERLLGQIERGEVINLSAMTKEERRAHWESNKAFKNVRGKLPPGLDIDLDP